MSHQDLRELVAQLHARLNSAQSLDAEDRQLLSAALGDISKALGRTPAPAPADPAKPRLEALAVKFEVDHPSLAQGLRDIADLLGKAGI
jgi:hypothetical protein